VHNSNASNKWHLVLAEHENGDRVEECSRNDMQPDPSKDADGFDLYVAIFYRR